MGETRAHELQEAMKQALAAGGVAPVENAAWKVSLTVAPSKISGYERECAAFRRKYGAPLLSFKASIEVETGRENFVVEEHRADWEFAEAALAEWQHRVEILRNAAP
jgi:hypothetical protein